MPFQKRPKIKFLGEWKQPKPHKPLIPWPTFKPGDVIDSNGIIVTVKTVDLETHDLQVTIRKNVLWSNWVDVGQVVTLHVHAQDEPTNDPFIWEIPDAEKRCHECREFGNENECCANTTVSRGPQLLLYVWDTGPSFDSDM